MKYFIVEAKKKEMHGLKYYKVCCYSNKRAYDAGK